MPAVVASWVNKRSFQKVNRILHDLRTSYRDDTVKYQGRIPRERLEEVLPAVPKLLGEKVVEQILRTISPPYMEFALLN